MQSLFLSFVDILNVLFQGAGDRRSDPQGMFSLLIDI